MMLYKEKQRGPESGNATGIPTQLEAAAGGKYIAEAG